MGTYSEDFSNGLPSNFAFDANGYRINTSDKPTGYTHSLQTRVITHRQSCEFSLTLEFDNAGQFSFYRRVSSESYYDLFYFYIDDVQKFRISGQGTWAKVTYDVTVGSHTFKWRYTKDVISSRYSDCGFITGITATNVDTTNHHQTIKCLVESYDDFYAVRSEQIIRCIGSQVHSVYAARMIQAVKADISCLTHPFLSGDGSLYNPFTLNKGKQLNEVRNFMSYHFKQVGDIDLSDFENWIPLGYDEDSNIRFTGSYDGSNFKITGLKMHQPPFSYEYNDVPLGLFLHFDSIYELKNIRLEGVDIVGAVGVGALVEYVTGGSIINCSSSGNIVVEPGSGVGGLIGIISTSELPVNIENCSSSVNISIKFREFVGSEAYGGLIGSAEVDPANPSAAINIFRCFATGNVLFNDTYDFFGDYTSMESMGGLIGNVVEWVYI